MEYHDFLKSKELKSVSCGFEPKYRNDMLFDWQSDIVRWACVKGKCAIFASCGTGKTALQLQWSYEVHMHTGKPVLILAPLAVWQRYASPVWMDINPSDTLQKESAREEQDERHICPLQLGVIRRALNLWTNPGDVVLTPFLGIGSEAYVALQMGRKAVGIELKGSYYKQAVANCSSVTEFDQISLL